jgi:hypothetical protein
MTSTTPEWCLIGNFDPPYFYFVIVKSSRSVIGSLPYEYWAEADAACASKNADFFDLR